MFKNGWIIRAIAVALGTICLITVVSVRATLLHVEAQAAVTSGNSIGLSYLAIGTVVHSSVDFDVGPGVPFPFPAINSANGTFTWNDGSARTFTVNSALIEGENQFGGVFLAFVGTGPTINGSVPSEFKIDVNIGVDPFTTLLQLSDLLPGSLVQGMRFQVFSGSFGGFGDLARDVSGSISPVSGAPEPATLALLGIGLAGLAASRRRVAA